MGMPRIDFDEWIPDQVMWNNRALINAKNVIPGPLGYKPLRSLTTTGSAFGTERIRGARTFRLSNSSLTTIGGSKTAIKKLNVGTGAWTDISDAVYSTDPEFGFWSLCQYGTLAVMTNLTDPVKKYDIVTGAATVSSLGGTPPKARLALTVKDQIVLAGLENSPAGVRWSDVFNPEIWSSGLAGNQDFPDGGRIMSANVKPIGAGRPKESCAYRQVVRS